MNGLPSGTQYWMVCGATDMRQGRHKLAEFVISHLQRRPRHEHVFLFCNAAEDQIRCLWWDRKGFSHYYCIGTPHGKFIWPQESKGTISLTRTQIKRLLEGADWSMESDVWPMPRHLKAA